MTTAFTLVQLRYFDTVARLEHMTAAAEQLNVTQSTLSSAIAQLEREIGVPLFTRLPRRGLRLTPAGKMLFARSGAFLEDAVDLVHAIREESDTLSGELTVGLYAPLAPFRAPILQQQFHLLHPDVKLTFLEGDQESLQRALTSGQCETALMYDLGVSDRFSRRVIERIPPHVIVSEEHPAAQQQSVSLHDFAEQPLILLNLPYTREYYLGLFKQLGIVPDVRQVSLGYETVRSFVALGSGYSVLNQWVDHGMTYAGARVVPLTLQEEFPPTEVCLVRATGTRLTRKALAFEHLCWTLYGRNSLSTER